MFVHCPWSTEFWKLLEFLGQKSIFLMSDSWPAPKQLRNKWRPEKPNLDQRPENFAFPMAPGKEEGQEMELIIKHVYVPDH